MKGDGNQKAWEKRPLDNPSVLFIHQQGSINHSTCRVTKSNPNLSKHTLEENAKQKAHSQSRNLDDKACLLMSLQLESPPYPDISFSWEEKRGGEKGEGWGMGKGKWGEQTYFENIGIQPVNQPSILAVLGLASISTGWWISHIFPKSWRQISPSIFEESN